MTTKTETATYCDRQAAALLAEPNCTHLAVKWQERAEELRAETAGPSDDALRALWRDAGGKFHGPNVETGTMPEDHLLPFLRGLLLGVIKARKAGAGAATREVIEEANRRG